MEFDFSAHQIIGLSLAPDFALSGAAYAATDQTLLVTQDGGQTWQDALRDLRAGEDSPVMAALCTRRGTVLAGVMGGILRSEDGRTWQSAPFGTPLPMVTALAETPSGDLLAGTAQDGVFISRDGGSSWTRWNFGLLDCHVYALLVANATAYAGVETGIFYSTNNGRAWRETDFPMEEAPVLSLCALGDRWLFAGTESGKLFRSADRGRSWQEVGQGVFEVEISALAGCAGKLYAASGERLLVSSDGGESWQAWQPPRTVEGSFLCLAGGEEKALAGTSGGQIFIV